MLLYGKVSHSSRLVYLLASPIPPIVSQAATRAFKCLAKPYEDFALAIKDPEALNQCLQNNEAVFTADKTRGLVNLVLEESEMRQIAALKDTYVAISLEDVARQVCNVKSEKTSTEDVQRMERLILRMVSSTYFPQLLTTRCMKVA